MPEHPARTFREAIQSFYFYQTCIIMEQNAASYNPGRMDQYLYPFFARDIASGILTEDELDRCIDYMKTLKNAGRFNYEIYAIVEAEAAAYFSGEATAEAVAKEIQAQVEEYMTQ